MDPAQTISAIRRFNRFYTPQIGVLEKRHMGLDYTLADSRVIYEIAQRDDAAPGAVAEAVGLDPGYLSRILKRLETEGLVERAPAPEDGRRVRLRLTPQGLEVFGELDRRTRSRVEALIAGLPEPGRAELAGALADVERLLKARQAEPVLREHGLGDMGWVVERHAVLYGREYGWIGFEQLVARICADFLDRFDPQRERCWIAERDGVRLGCIFLIGDEAQGSARIRLLLLEPEARGLGLGRRLVEAAVEFARQAGYRDVVLWTHQVLTAARATYAKLGFVLEDTWIHDDFGKSEVSETWRLAL